MMTGNTLPAVGISYAASCMCSVSTGLPEGFGILSHNSMTAYSSSTWHITVGLPNMLVDGNLSSNWVSGSCAATSCDDPRPWFVIDLVQVRQVAGLRIINRLDCCTGKYMACKCITAQGKCCQGARQVPLAVHIAVWYMSCDCPVFNTSHELWRC